MADIFDYGEIKRVSMAHNNMISHMESIIKLYDNIRTEMINDALICVNNPMIQDIIRNEIMNGADQIRSNASIVSLIKKVFLLRYIEPIRNEMIKLLNTSVPVMQDNLLNMNRASNKLKSLFLSEEKRRNANNSFIFLSQALGGKYGTSYMRLVNYYNNIVNADINLVWQDFLVNKSGYKETYIKHSQNEVRDVGIRAIDEILYEYEMFKKRSVSNDASIDETKNNISRFIGLSILDEAKKQLNTIPVQEICKNSSARASALERSGYRTVGDVCDANEITLSYIPGISKRSAYDVKHNADIFKREIERNTKIKLSLDDLTVNKRAALTQIAIYQDKNDAKRKLIEQNEIEASNLSHSSAKLKEASGCINWFFLTDAEKQQVRTSYNYMKEILFSEYTNNIYRLTKIIDEGTNISFSEVSDRFRQDPVPFFNVIENICPGALGNSDKYYGLEVEFAKKIQTEKVLFDGLKCTLRNYQDMGVRYILHQKKVLLGDEMGLGKTIQAIAAMVSLKNFGATHFVVVCPASVLINWCREIAEHSDLKPIKVHGYDKKIEFENWLNNGGVCVTTYETTKIFTSLYNYNIDMLVVDEAHYVKNPSAMRTKNVAVICEHTDRILFMTGTPLENKVDEMIALINMIRPIIADQMQYATQSMYSENFKRIIMPVYYRRKRDDVLTELPEKIESEEWLEPSSADMSAYLQALEQGSYNHHEIRKVSWNVTDISKSSKAKRLKELVEEAFEEGRKIIVYSFYLGVIELVRDILGSKCVGVINGSVSPKERQNIIDRFDRAEDGAVLVAQIQSGGVGLNIQAASVIIICEPQVKPSIESQAISRAYRMGQTRNVLVYRLLCKNTIDERMMTILAKKQREFDKYADKSLAAEQFVSIDDKSLTSMIEEEIKEKLGTKIDIKNPIPLEDKEMVNDKSEISPIEQVKPKINYSKKRKASEEDEYMGLEDAFF